MRSAVRVSRLGRLGAYGAAAGIVGLSGYAAYRGYRRIRAKRVGRLRRVQGTRSKANTLRNYVFGSNSNNQILDRKTLAAEEVRMINSPQGNSQLHAAEKPSYFCKGFKLCATFRNRFNAPINVHMAYVQTKDDNQDWRSDLKENFFIDHSNSTTRFANFVERANDAIWNRTQDCSQLNPNKFNILHKESFLLNPGTENNTYSRESGTSWIHYNKYIKVNKRFDFDLVEASNVVNPIICMVWFEHVLPADPVNAVQELSFNINTVGYSS